MQNISSKYYKIIQFKWNFCPIKFSKHTYIIDKRVFRLKNKRSKGRNISEVRDHRKKKKVSYFGLFSFWP